ncbi:MAG TPA: histidine kinase dimerization/phospho-acceptor domain-containing protein [Ktedonobacteraceae bacterium]|nr:histidine kinase dimerization/phospho-acceptor domain-containing protein [Ktedonobacteraceae bacterium]
MSLFVREKRNTRVVDWLNARLSLIFVLILVVFLLGIGASVYAFNVQRHLDDQKVLLREDADGMLQAMIDQQSGLRDYISSNKSVFLAPFLLGRPAYLASLQDLTTQLQTGPFQHTLIGLSTVQETADEWYSIYAISQIQEMQAGKFTEARSDTSILNGSTLFTQFRAAMNHLQETIGQDLAVYQNQVDTINLSLLFGVLLLAIIANAAFLYMLRTLTRRLQTQIVSLTSTTERLGQGEQAARVIPLSFADLDQVGQSINRMAGAIEQHQQAIEESMRALERQYALVERAQSESRAIFDASSEAFLFISASGQVNALNRLFREFFAMSAEGVIGMTFADLQPRWEALLVNAVSFHAELAQDSTNQERYYTTTVTQKEPQYRELAVSSTPVPSSTNAYLGRLYILRDITREREAERLKAEFDALVSHGLRSPLTSIKGYTDLLVQQEETGPLTDLQREFLEIVQSNTRRLLALVNDLLDMSRLEAQTMVIRPVPLDLHSLIHVVTRDMRPQIEERHQRLSLRLASSPLIVLADEIRVGQILTNLLTFAVNHTPVGGRIDWQTQLEDAMVRITCSSSGDLSAEDLATFTHPFFQDSALSPSAMMGSVLGPSITRSLVELHGGTLQVSAKAEEGCAFTFTLPLSPS